MIPVIMFHSVGLEESNWISNYLSVPLIQMKALIQFLSENKYDTLFLDDWYQLQGHAEDKKSKKVFLTFDDGYLDSWVYLFPLLEKFNVKVTVFINPEFVDPSKALRPNLRDVWDNKVEKDKVSPKGYLNWVEIAKMNNSGLVDIQSHSMSHNWYFKNERIIDIYLPENKKHFWLAWLAKPDRKPFWITENQWKFIPEGTPIFENGRSLGIRRYFPDRALVDFSVDLFRRRLQPDRAKAISACNKFMAENGSSGRSETDEEMIRRYFYELRESKEVLEKRLNKKVNFLCWPGGAYNDLSDAISKEAGYLGSTVASSERHLSFDNSAAHKRIVRTGIGSSFSVRGRTIINNNPNALVRSFQELEGQWYWKYPRRFKKAFYYLRPKA